MMAYSFDNYDTGKISIVILSYRGKVNVKILSVDAGLSGE